MTDASLAGRLAGERVRVDGTNRARWALDADGLPVKQALAVPGSEDAIVRLSGFTGEQPLVPTWRPFRESVVRATPAGEILWRAELPATGPDAYLAVEWIGDDLYASSFSGFRVVLDPATGRIATRRFTG